MGINAFFIVEKSVLFYLSQAKEFDFNKVSIRILRNLYEYKNISNYCLLTNSVC